MGLVFIALGVARAQLQLLVVSMNLFLERYGLLMWVSIGRYLYWLYALLGYISIPNKPLSIFFSLILIVLGLSSRFPLVFLWVISIGVFLASTNIYHLHWAVALLIAFPSLILQALLTIIIYVNFRFFSSSNEDHKDFIEGSHTESPSNINELDMDQILKYKSIEEFMASRPDISRDQCEALWDYFKKPDKSETQGKLSSTIDPASAWPFPTNKR